MYVYQNSGGEAFVMDAEGRCHRFQHDAPTEVKPQITMDIDKGGMPAEHTIPAVKVAEQLCKDGIFYGIVIVPEIREGLNIRFDVDTAARESTRKRGEAEMRLIDDYVKRSKEQQLMNMPIRPPAPSLEKILNARGLDLDRDYGIKPVGYRIGEAAKARDAEIAALKTETAELKAMISRLLDVEEKKSRKETVKA